MSATTSHEPVVPPWAGPPWCTCGWRSARFPKPGEYLADHLAQFHTIEGGAAHA